ncbi:MAG: pyrroloquinoline quinone-dependent dehydrogenase [Acidobacteriia bacterium]|nr:pyrroloquinoline quinone-dependent dehydrogenase [Terriglobia bacterium]
MIAHCAIVILVFILTPALGGQTGWPVYGHDPGGTRYSPLKQIDTRNVSKLQLAWTYDTEAVMASTAAPTPGRNPSGRPRMRRSSTTPLVIDGVLYMSTAYNRVVALEPETGKKLWEYESQHTPGMRGIAYWPGDAKSPARIIFGTTDGWLISLNAKTGQPVPGFGNEGLVNLRPGVADKFPNAMYGLSSPPTLIGDLIITGSHVQEAPSLGPSGDIRAWDVRTGKLVWTFHTIPRPDEPNHEAWAGDQWVDRSGANAWGFITADLERGLLFVPLGTPTTDFYGADRKGSNLYGSSLVALEAATGKLEWFYQTTHHDNWDYDLESPPLLLNVRRNGKPIPAVAVMTKQSLLFILDRTTGKPVYDVEERPVISDNLFPGGGDEPWPTQPFPLKPPPLARNSFRPEEIATVTPEHERYCRALLAEEGGALTGGPYSQYGPKLRVIFPAWIGGGNWGGMSFDPHLGYLFVNTQSVANFNKIVKSEDGTRFLRVGPDNKSLSLGEGNLFWDGEKNWPCQRPPWGELMAVNANTAEIAWRVPLGSFEELDAQGVPKTGTPNMGGSIATAGGLVFIAATVDTRFRAFDSHTGKELWVTKLATDAQSTPITFLGKDHKQYVAVMASGAFTTSGPTCPGGYMSTRYHEPQCTSRKWLSTSCGLPWNALTGCRSSPIRKPPKSWSNCAPTKA